MSTGCNEKAPFLLQTCCQSVLTGVTNSSAAQQDTASPMHALHLLTAHELISFTQVVKYLLQVSFDIDLKVNVFEANIRLLGGLLSAHLLASDPNLGLMQQPYQGQLLHQATDLGDRLLAAFDASLTGECSHEIAVTRWWTGSAFCRDVTVQCNRLERLTHTLNLLFEASCHAHAMLGPTHARLLS